ncbi:hypothetical protein DFJ58DRAFT_912513 [Suillus subalutaceus]|uniref:uncharacterized protein n=1 Tax=Suillus subalutaceus TaxID=48586 RepID=UPI001B8687F7|nr:uncharacterized protein DFJ58DRAFT_912513 [Suillus subalutaceus]KAG1862490.1 hypothetical protein DFJ58DRAFT_912513 [Suillus subalutaceus]
MSFVTSFLFYSNAIRALYQLSRVLVTQFTNLLLTSFGKINKRSGHLLPTRALLYSTWDRVLYYGSCIRGIPAPGAALGCLTEKCSMLEQVHIFSAICCYGVGGLHAPVFSSGQNYTLVLYWITRVLEGLAPSGSLGCARQLWNIPQRFWKLLAPISIEALLLWVDGPVSVLAFYSLAKLLSPNRTDEGQLKFISIKNFKFIAKNFFARPFDPVPLSQGTPVPMISPLFALHDLRSFKIDVMNTVAAGHAIGGLMPALCRDDLETIPQAWKNIEELELQWLRSGTEKDARIDDNGEIWESEEPTLAEVALLASRCEKLFSLGIWFNAQDWFDDDLTMDSNGEVEAEDLAMLYEKQERRTNTQGASSHAAAISAHLDHSNGGPSSRPYVVRWTNPLVP